MKPRERAVLSASFVLTGSVTTLLGPWLPYFSARYALDDATAGRLFFVQFLSSTVAAALLGTLVRHMRAERCLAISYLAMSCGVIALGFAGPWSVLAAVACYGFGIGINNPAASMLAVRGSPGHEAAAMNLLNMAWSAGAVIAPPLLAYFFAQTNAPLVLVGLGIPALIAAAAHWPLRIEGPTQARANEAIRSLEARTLAIAAGAFLFLYVGAENAVSGWLPTYAQRHCGFAPRYAGFAQSAFWCAILAGRFLVSLRAAWIAPSRWIVAGLAVSTVGITALLVAPHPIAIVIAGLGMAPLFPTMIAIFQVRAGEAAAPLLGYVFAASGCGGAVFPWIVGVLSSSLGSLRIALVAAILATFGMWIAARATSPRTIS